MRMTTVKPGQTLPDIAVQHCGHLSAWAGIAALNGLGLTDALAAGQVLKLPDIADKRVVAYLKAGGHEPAAGAVQAFVVLEGIGYWAIEEDFEVQ